MSRVLAISHGRDHVDFQTGAGSSVHIGDAAILTRRLDWRFLLPNSHLGRVAYIGRGSGSLVQALTLFCDSLSLPFKQPVGRETADLLVAQSSSPAEIGSALYSLAPDGIVYWEMKPLRRFLRADAAQLSRLGLEVIDTFWHHPDFERCELIVPLSAPAPLAWLAARRLPGTDRRTLLRFSRWFTNAPSLWRLLPSVSVIARRRKASWYVDDAR